MHSIIQKQHALKQKEKREGVKSDKSHLQRTPAFIQSAVQAALENLAAQEAQHEQHAAEGMAQAVAVDKAPFPPPKGGFTDVGLHTGSQPKATAWPVLKSMVQVSHGILARCTLLLFVHSLMLLSACLTDSVDHSVTT
jgi:hypothetical protein